MSKLMITLIPLCLSLCWWIGYLVGYDQGFGDGCDAEKEAMQTRNMEALIRTLRKEK